MNERIKEILIQTIGKEGVVAGRAFGHWALSDEELEKFAELIVRECAGIVNKNDFEGSSLGDRLLFEHFGVE